MKKAALSVFISLIVLAASAQSPGIRLGITAMQLWKDTGDPGTARWTYDEGVLWKGLEGLWLNTGDARYFKYIQRQVDRLVDREGNIRSYKQEDDNPDNILCGRVVLMLYKVTGQEKYYKAAGRLRQQLREQPRTSEGSYMAQPFLAEYAALFHEDSVFEDITRQFVAIEEHSRDLTTGLLYHGWDKSRAMGWYGMALVDALEHYPAQARGRKVLLAILERYAAAVRKVQDAATASASCMFVYTLAKGVRLGYLPATYSGPAEKGYQGILKKFIANGGDGQTEKVPNDPGGIGTFLLAADEMDVVADRAAGRGRTVLLDYYFNNERHIDVTGASVRFHYTWEEMGDNGYSLWGHLFRQYGMATDSLVVAPTPGLLKRASVYIIVDPDNEREAAAPNYPAVQDIAAIDGWVRAGGVLALMGNDSANMEFTHFNVLAGKFGIHFNFDDYHKVTGSQFEMGAFFMTAQDSLFPTTKKIYIKELSTLALSGPARPHFTDGGKVIMAVAKVGKGTVFAVGDPWLYNEYTDGRRLPTDFENFNAARDLTQWLIRQANNNN